MIKRLAETAAQASPMDWIKNTVAILAVVGMTATTFEVFFGGLADIKYMKVDIQNVEKAIDQLSATIEQYSDEARDELEEHDDKGAHGGAITEIALLKLRISNLTEEIQALRLQLSSRDPNANVRP